MSFEINIKELDWRTLEVDAMTKSELDKLLPRADFSLKTALETVRPMLEQVKNKGVAALYEFARQFDSVEQDPKNAGSGIKIPQDYLKKSWNSLSTELKDALLEAKERITTVHLAQVPSESTTELAEGAVVRQKWFPIGRVGLYVPGGLAVYPSSVLMNAIPAKCAGIQDLIIASPPQKEFDGYIHSTIAAAAYFMDIDNVYAVGGAGAVGMFAYGVEGVPRVDTITGPGNIYVAAAKQLVQSSVGIDAVAGPTEIAIIADDSASPEFLAADMISQAEHDSLAAAVLFTNSEELAKNTRLALSRRAEKTKHHERVKVALEGAQSAIVVVKSLDDAVILANAYGAEHLEIQTKKNKEITQQITNAGAIFVGAYSPVPLGDYIGGSNHVLPTTNSSRFSSGLGVHSFLRSVQETEYTEHALEVVRDKLVLIANDEDLPAHGEGVLARFE
ncbi:MAG: histidinol dehydrogenase [Candidatus Ancillula trichonymphae]|jgi:histidinol dehydrogenase|nr:histidinol dehydrogenase [Candidatus Ancillula trichonymphae]